MGLNFLKRDYVYLHRYVYTYIYTRLYMYICIGFRGLGFRVRGLGFRVKDLGFGVQGFPKHQNHPETLNSIVFGPELLQP